MICYVLTSNVLGLFSIVFNRAFSKYFNVAFSADINHVIGKLPITANPAVTPAIPSHVREIPIIQRYSGSIYRKLSIGEKNIKVMR